MANKLVYLSMLLLTASVEAGKYRLCACIKDDMINDEATMAVVKAGEGRYVYSPGYWYTGFLHDAPYTGSYWHAIDGDVNGASDDGWIGAKESSNVCSAQGVKDSICFTPADVFNWQSCGSWDCFTSLADKTDQYGFPIVSTGTSTWITIYPTSTLSTVVVHETPVTPVGTPVGTPI